MNESPHNTGRTGLAPVEQPEVWCPYGPPEQFPELGTGGSGPMVGPA